MRCRLLAIGLVLVMVVMGGCAPHVSSRPSVNKIPQDSSVSPDATHENVFEESPSVGQPEASATPEPSTAPAFNPVDPADPDATSLPGTGTAETAAPETTTSPSENDPESTKYVALTFDDGPHKSNTPRLLDALKEYGAHATFFVVANRADTAPDALKRMAEEGHEIGTHTYDHKSILADDFSIADEITKSCDIIEQTSGVRPTLLRPPYGSFNTKMLTKIGMPGILWDIDPEDWKYKDADIVSKAILDKVQDGDIILLHDIHSTSVDAAIIVLRELTKQGYKFVTVSELLGDTLTVGYAYRSRDKVIKDRD